MSSSSSSQSTESHPDDEDDSPLLTDNNRNSSAAAAKMAAGDVGHDEYEQLNKSSSSSANKSANKSSSSSADSTATDREKENASEESVSSLDSNHEFSPLLSSSSSSSSVISSTTNNKSSSDVNNNEQQQSSAAASPSSESLSKTNDDDDNNRANRKRKLLPEEAGTTTTTTTAAFSSSSSSTGLAVNVAAHYNAVKQAKAGDAFGHVQSGKRLLNVLDICCGKGGDLFKWNKSQRVRTCLFTDIAEISLNQCRGRYDQLKQKDRLFPAYFIAADATRIRLRDHFIASGLCSELDQKPENVRFQLVSCQFALHYAFESEAQARRMIQNITENLAPGGVFVGTLPDANFIISQLRSRLGNRIDSSVFKLAMDRPENLTDVPLFGGKYHFHLDAQVNVPEFIVYFPLLQKLLEEVGMELIFKKSFERILEEQRATDDEEEENFGLSLLKKMKTFETYPIIPSESRKLVGDPETDYLAAGEKMNELIEEGEWKMDSSTLGTMSRPEWEVANVYLAFMFRKKMTA